MFPVIKGQKEITGSPATIPAGGFSFVLKNGSGDTVGTAQISQAGTFTFTTGVPIPTCGSITLTMSEVQPNPVPAYWTYSHATYKVTINSNGSVTYQTSSGTALEGLPIFTNSYTTPPPATVDIHGTKAVTGSPTSNPTFSFVLKDGAATVGTAQVTGAGDFTFTGIPVPASGSRTLAMTEVQPNPLPTGWTYSTASYTVTINSNGSVVYNTSDGQRPTFTNNYITPPPPPPPPATVDIHGTKAVTGSPTSTPTFSFVLKDSTATIGTAQVTGAGDFTFTGIPVPASGSRTFTMSEVQPNPLPTGWTYSTASYTVTINSNGSVVYNTSDGQRPTFTNNYITPPPPPPPATVDIHGTKAVTGSLAATPTFSFVLKDGAATVGTAQVTGAGDFTFTGIPVPASGSRTLTMSEVQPSPVPTGWTYSTASYTVTINSNGSVVYNTSDGIPLDGLPIFTNSYTTPPPATVDIHGTKAVTGSPAATPTFSFVLKDGAATVGTAQVTGVGDFTFTGIPVPASGSRTLAMTEVQPNPLPTGWTYSTASYTVTINSNGSVVYNTSDGQQPTFTNNYTTPVLSTIQATKIITGNPATTPAGGFNFVLKDGTTTVGTATIDQAQTFAFTMNDSFHLPASGTTTLVMSEVQPSPVPAGWTYSTATYNVIIGADGSVAYQTSDGIPLDALPIFVNSYLTTPTLGVIQATKVITGNPAVIPGDGFSFVLKDGAATVGTATIDQAQTFAFTMNGNFQLPESGTTTLVMSEVQPSPVPVGWTYSAATYNVIVSADGSVTYQTGDGIPLDGLPVFTNSYTAPVLSTIQATKIIAGNPATLPEGGFSFVLKDGTATVGTAQIGKSGTATFTMSDGFHLPASGTTTLVMSEVQPSPVPAGWTYSTATYNVIIGADGSVTYQTGDGTVLSVLPMFINSYILTPQLGSIQATKIVTGNPAAMPEGGFSFVLKDGAATVGTAQIDKAGTITFTMSDSFHLPASGTTTLVMSEVQPSPAPAGWTYSTATYNVIIGADGSITYQTSDGKSLDGLPSFTNSYTAIPVTPETPTPTAVAGESTAVAGESTAVAQNPYTGDTAYPPVAAVFAMLGLAGLVTFTLRSKRRDRSNDKNKRD